MTHLVVIVPDTLRIPSNTPGFDPALTMPFLSSMIPLGTSYSRAVASSPWTVPSHVSLLTGLPPWAVHHHPGKLSVPSAPSLASAWKDAGGQALAFSGNGFVAPDYGTLPGFERINKGAPNRTLASKVWRWIVPFLGDAPLDEDKRSVSFFSVTETSEGTRRPVFALGSRALGASVHAGAKLLQDGTGLNWGIDKSLRTLDQKNPLHLFVNYMEVHEPYTLHPKWNAGPMPTKFFLPNFGLARHCHEYGQFPEAGNLVRESYLLSMHYLDARIRALFGVLRKRGILDDARILIVSDHGQALGEGGFYGHGYVLDDPVLRIPCISWLFKNGKAQPSEGDTSNWFDHRHLFDALKDLAKLGAGTSLTEALERAISLRGAAVSYWEGPDPPSPGKLIGWSTKLGPARSLKLMDGDEHLVIDQGLQEKDGRLRLDIEPKDNALWKVAENLIAGDPTGSIQSKNLSGEVQKRLQSWGYS
jgi:hypothetical protein